MFTTSGINFVNKHTSKVKLGSIIGTYLSKSNVNPNDSHSFVTFISENISHKHINSTTDCFRFPEHHNNNVSLHIISRDHPHSKLQNTWMSSKNL